MSWNQPTLCRHPLRILAGLFASIIFGISLAHSQGAVSGDWIGGFERGTDWLCVIAHFEMTNGTLGGTVQFPLESRPPKTSGQFSLARDWVDFQLLEGPHVFKVHVKLKGGVMAGEANRGGKRSRFRLDRIAKTEVERYAGAYEMDDGHFLQLKPEPELNMLGVVDFNTGEARGFFPSSETSFFCGPTLLVPHPVEAVIRFAIDQHTGLTNLVWEQKGRAPRTGRPCRLAEENVSFKNGEVTLAGTLILPKTKGPHPAVVMVHGSNPSSRDALRLMADYFALQGVATLVYDKRGTGASTGDFDQTRFEELAGDALAGVKFLKGRPDLNSKQTGLWGVSQGGWLVALAAACSPDVSFIISQSGPGCTVEEQDVFNNGNRVRVDGFSEAEIKQAVAFELQNCKCARTDRGWDELAATTRVASVQPWYPYIAGAVVHKGDDLAKWRSFLEYDPVPALQKIHCPVLAIFGGLDQVVPVEKSADIWRQATAKAGNKDVTIKIFPHGNHSLVETKTGALRDSALAKRFVPGFFDLQRDWLLKRVRVTSE
jgi:uncharacterized protein